MRTPRQPQSTLRAPLNALLGTEANVRLLRVLALAGSPMAAGELAKRAQLGRTTIYPALDALEKSGIVEFAGVGAQRQAGFRRGHPLAGPLLDLFSAESMRVDALIAALRDSVGEMSIRPTAAWLEGSADADARIDGRLTLWIVADPKRVAVFMDSLSEPISRVEKQFGVHCDIRGMTRSELEARAKTEMTRLRDATVLAGVPPMALLAATPKKPAPRSLKYHSAHDEGARRLAVAIAAKVKWDPTLVRVAHAHVLWRMKRASAGERKELQEWSRILTAMTPGQIQRFLTDRDERAERLRQTLPALGLLTPVEREAVLASATDDEARAAVTGR